MKKKIIWIFISAILLIGVIFVIKAFLPRPIADSGIEEVVQVQFNWNYGEEDSKLEVGHFIPEKVAECLSKYKEQRTFVRHKGYAMKNVQMSILIRTNKGTKDIIIGDDTYTQQPTGPAYRILEEEKFIKEIFDVCGYKCDNN